MERIFNLIPIVYDTYRDVAEVREFQTVIFNIKNMIELHKLGGKITIPYYNYDIEETIKLYNNTNLNSEQSKSARLLKRFDEPDFAMKVYKPTEQRIHQELSDIFNDLFYTDLGYPNFSHIFTKPEGGRFVALKENNGFKIISIDKQTFDLLDYIHGVMSQAKTLAIRNELIK